jgi:hypothetical protein
MRGRIRKLLGREQEDGATCRLCGAPISPGKGACPLCGYVMGGEANVFYIRDDARGRTQVRGVPSPAPAARAQERPIAESPDDVGADASDGMMGDVEGELDTALGLMQGTNADPPAFALNPPGLREILAAQPEMLEPGLTQVTDKKGKAVGAGFPTAVGPIDLLARDASGAFVVVTVAGRGQGEDLVKETLERVGWVRKHLGIGKQPVRAIILIEQVPENFSYAAAAVADTIRFKTYRVALRFHDLDT